jgi:hypothetical protein
MDQCWLRRFAQVPNHAPDVGFGSLADLNQSMFDVRYSPEGGHRHSNPACPLSARRRHRRCPSLRIAQRAGGVGLRVVGEVTIEPGGEGQVRPEKGSAPGTRAGCGIPPRLRGPEDLISYASFDAQKD